MKSRSRKVDSDRAEGERLKCEAHALLEARRELYVRRGRRALLRAMLDGDGRATADDVRAAVELPADLDPRFFGSVPGRLAYDRIIDPDGFVRSGRPEGHARWLQVWKLTDCAKARSWLADNPDLPDPGDDDRDQRQGLLFDVQPQKNATPTGEAAGAA